MIIKLLLLTGLGMAAIALVRRKQTAFGLLMRRSLALGVILLGALGVLFPSAVTAAANAVGVGRGADLVLYVLCVASLLVAIALYTQINRLQDRLVELTRRLSIHEAECTVLDGRSSE